MTFAFGPFELDARAKRLMRNGERLALSPRHLDLLCALVASAGEVLSKDQLIQVGWRDVAVTDNSLEQAISALRRTLGPDLSGDFIHTEARRGYRFTTPVTRTATRESDEALEALLAPHRAWIEGRAALETLERDQIAHARAVFEEVLHRIPDQAPVHVGLANACAMQFEMTRADQSPDRAALTRAVHHAHEACRFDPSSGEAWATLGFVLDRTGAHNNALAAGRRAVTLEPDNWRHHVRLAYCAWGEERLRSARRALALLPGFPLAHWLAATVHVARGNLSEAARELDAGLAAPDAGEATPARFSAVALHWLRGLLHLAAGRETPALAEFTRELSLEPGGHLYARECCANTWYAIGALHFWRGRLDEALDAFERAIERVGKHPMAALGLATVRSRIASPTAPLNLLAADHPRAATFDGSLHQAAAAILETAAPPTEPVLPTVRHAAQIVDEGMAHAASPSSGWLLPVEPLMRVWTAPEAWATVLAQVRQRAA